MKYPFFEYGPRYAAATGESLLEGYHKMGRGVIIAYFVLTFATMFTIQTAVTVVTAGIATSVFGIGSVVGWTVIITVICSTILIIGRYKALDLLMKIVVIGLTVSTIIAVVLAIDPTEPITITQLLPSDVASLAFLIAFMGWMPAPLDISIWHSIWTVEKKRVNPDINPRQSRFDFNVGYITLSLIHI